MVLIWTGFSIHMTSHYHMTLICIILYDIHHGQKNEIHSLWHANEYSIFLCFDNIFIVYMLRFLLPFFVVNSYLFHKHNFKIRDSLYTCFAAFFSNLWFPRHIFFWSFIFFKGTCIIWVLFLWPLKVSYRIVSHILI